jgi:hypothetical protein
MAIKYIATFSNLRPSKSDPKLELWFENKPSGNPGRRWQRDDDDDGVGLDHSSLLPVLNA